MKVNQLTPPPAFKPVTITLETQAEVDALYAFFNNTALCSAFINDAFGNDAWELLQPYRSDAYNYYQRKLNEAINE